MRFLADENISRRVIETLRSAGHEIYSIAENSPGISDRNVLSVAFARGAIIITEDQDFGELVIRNRLPASGVILLELDRLSSAAEAKRVAGVVTSLAQRLSGHLVVVAPDRTRLRPLPSAIT